MFVSSRTFLTRTCLSLRRRIRVSFRSCEYKYRYLYHHAYFWLQNHVSVAARVVESNQYCGFGSEQLTVSSRGGKIGVHTRDVTDRISQICSESILLTELKKLCQNFSMMRSCKRFCPSAELVPHFWHFVDKEVRKSSACKQTRTEFSRRNHYVKFCNTMHLDDPCMRRQPPEARNYFLACYAVSLVQGHTIKGTYITVSYTHLTLPTKA